jgi:hypothetical protein
LHASAVLSDASFSGALHVYCDDNAALCTQTVEPRGQQRRSVLRPSITLRVIAWQAMFDFLYCKSENDVSGALIKGLDHRYRKLAGKKPRTCRVIADSD